MFNRSSNSFDHHHQHQENQYYTGTEEANTEGIESQRQTSSGVFSSRFKNSNKAAATPSKGNVEFVGGTGAASTSKVPTARISRTPGRGLLKRLFRTPAKSESKKSRAGLVITPSKEEKLGLAAGSRRVTSPKSAVILRRAHSTGSRTDFSGAVVSATEHSTSSDTEGSSVITQKRVNSRVRRSFSSNSPTSNDLQEHAMSAQSPHVARRLLAEEDLNADKNIQQNPMEQQKTQSAGDSSREQPIDAALLAATDSSERQSDLIFVSKSSSSSEENMIPRDDQSPSSKLQPIMSRGISIPTPSINKRSTPGSYRTNEASNLFSRPLKSATESPAIKTNFLQRLETNPRSNSEANNLSHVEEDDDAFLPDDFERLSPTLASKTYTKDQVQQMIEDAKKAAEEAMCKEYDVKMEELEKNYNESLMEHGLEWRNETEIEHKRLMDRFRAEKAKAAEKRQELLEKSQQLEEYKAKVEEYEQAGTMGDDIIAAQELYKNQLQDKITVMQEDLSKLQNAEIRSNEMVAQVESLLQAKEQASQRIEELEKQLETAEKLGSEKEFTQRLLDTAEEKLDELKERDALASTLEEELVVVKGEKEQAERQVNELTERLRVRTESNNDALTRLEEAENEIMRLKSELSSAMENGQQSVEELNLAQRELQNLQSLRTPQKSRSSENPPESPCSEVDILRVDNNKIHEQLKAMGKVLKRYKTERDEIKSKMVQTIEVAVTQTKKGMQEKLDASSEQIKQLEKQIEDLEAKLKEEVDNRTKKEDERSVLREQFDKEKEELLDSQKKEKEQYESDLQLAKSKSQEEIERIEKKSIEYQELQKQMEKMQELHQEEVELVQHEAREETKLELEQEINSLKSQLSSTKSERDELVKKISELENAIEDLKSTKETVKTESDSRLNEIEAAHTKEIDGLMAELDLIEAESVEKSRKLQESLKEKETVISAMGKQLAGAESRHAAANENEKSLQRKIDELQVDVAKLKAELRASEEELADQVVLKEKAIDDVAKELTTKAQQQFEERNELYRGLKRKFDEATSKVSVLERDLRFAKKELDEAKKRHEARDADLKDELAQAKASVVKSDANIARMEKKHRMDMQRSKEELEEAKATSQQIQKSLAIIVTEKESLQKEVKEMKKISEELLEIVERNNLA